MGMENSEHRALLFHSSVTCIYFSGILFFLYITEHLYNVGTYKFISVLSSLILAEFVKLSIINLQTEKLHGKAELNNSSKAKKTHVKIVKDVIKFCVAVTGITIIYYIVIVVYGAPLLSHYEETLLLALTLTTLTLIPASLHLGIDNALPLFNGSSMFVGGIAVDAVKLNVKLVLLGTWLGAFVLPLDWDRPWQAWPIPCIIGALLGYFSAHFITFLKIFTSRIRKRNKKTDTVKSC